MVKHGHPSIRAAIAALALAVAVPAFADTAPLPVPADHAGHWHHRHRMRSPFMRALHHLDLSDAQKQVIRDDFRQSRVTAKAQFQNLRAKRRAFQTAVPGDAGYDNASLAYAQAAATAAQARVRRQTRLRSEIYGQLTDAQRSQLAQLLAADRARRAAPR